MKRSIFILLILSFCLICGFALATSDLTLMIYMTGSDLESQAGAASADLEEIQAACPAEGLNILVLTGGASRWNNGIPGDKNILWQVTPEGLDQLEACDASSMGDPATLSGFLKRAAALCPAEKFALILWDHGAGPMLGVCFDERFHSDGLTLEELTLAFQDSLFSDTPLAFIGFDACLMSSAEVAGAMAPYAEYMIASQEPEPAAGWDYRFISSLGQTANGEEAGKLIIDAFAVSQQDTMSAVTLSCLDLREMRGLEEALDQLFGNLSGQVTADSYPLLAACRYNTKILGASTPMEWDLVDLLDLVNMLEEEYLADASALREALEKTVVYHYTNEKYVSGLSIYAPFGNKERYVQGWASQYDSVGLAQGYRNYTKAFADQWLENQRGFWREAEALEAAEDRNREFLSIQLTEEEAKDVASARLLILEQTTMGGKEEYRLLNTVENLHPVENLLSAAYHQEALYLMLEDGTADGPLVWRPLDSNTSALGLDRPSGGIATFSRVESPSHESMFMYLTWIQGEDGFYHPGTPYLLNEDLDIFSVSARGLQPGDLVEMGGYMRRIPEQDAFYQEWDNGDIVTYCQNVYTGESEWKLAFLPLQSSGKRFALFEITDYHGNAHLSKPIELPDTSTIALVNEPVSRQEGALEVTLESANLYTGADASLTMELSLKNDSEQAMTVQLDGAMLNQTMLSDTRMRYTWGEGDFGFSCELNPGVPKKLQIKICQDELQLVGERQLRSVRVYLSRYRKSYECVQTIRFDFDIPVHLGIVLPFETAGEEAPFAVLDQQGVRFSVNRIGYNPIYYDYVAEGFLENRTDEDLWVKNIYYRINGSDWLGGVWNLLLPAHCRMPLVQSVSEYTGEAGEYKKTFPVNDSSEIESLVLSIDLEREIISLEETVLIDKKP